MSTSSFADHLAGKADPQAPPIDTIADVLHDIRGFLHRYVRVTDEQATLIAVWIAMTHALEAFEFCAYIHITSPLPECGKTRLLEVLESLVRKPWFTARVSAAVLMRKVDKEQPTLLLDESDAAFNGGDEQYSESLRGMLNAGFHRGGKASVCIGQGANLQYRDFSVFGAKAIAGIGRLPPTVMSRSIPIVMKRRMKEEPVSKWRRRDGWAAAATLRERLVAMMTREIETLRSKMPVCPDGLSDRAEDVLEPLFSISDVASGEWPDAVRAAAVALMGATRTARETEQDIRLELLADIRQIFEAHPTKAALATKVIVDGLVALEDRPWATLGRNDKPINAHRLSRFLKGFEIQPAGTIREGTETFKGYRRVVFEEAFSRYLGSKASQRNNPNEYGPESPKTEASHEESVTDSKTAKTPDKHCVCDAVTLSNPDREGKPDPKEAAAPEPPEREVFDL